ncbi:hypothetical protein POTOM_056982 [Populus tomentosa]|uniref:Glycosyltransferases n=1 Tax=Populus tomentosa TaxID=118781 RepID=A0A8X8C318_POPTO|nr:hypothetical protein POTOM_056982 [Populus tomentosa]
MASIRRTLSPVPTAGTLLNGEACQVASPFSKYSYVTYLEQRKEQRKKNEQISVQIETLSSQFQSFLTTQMAGREVGANSKGILNTPTRKEKNGTHSNQERVLQGSRYVQEGQINNQEIQKFRAESKRQWQEQNKKLDKIGSKLEVLMALLRTYLESQEVERASTISDGKDQNSKEAVIYNNHSIPISDQESNITVSFATSLGGLVMSLRSQERNVRESEFYRYEERHYKDLKKERIRVRVSSSFYKCRYCHRRDYHLWEFLQHAYDLGRGSKRGTLKEEAQHLALARYIQRHLDVKDRSRSSLKRAVVRSLCLNAKTECHAVHDYDKEHLREDTRVMSLKIFKTFGEVKTQGTSLEEGPFPFLRLFCDWGFVGLTPIVSMDLSVNPMSKQRAFSFEVVSATGNFNKHQDMTRNATTMAESGGLENNTTLDHNSLMEYSEFTRFFLAAVQNMDSCKLTVNRNKDFVEGSICNGTQAIGWHVNESSRRFQRFDAGMSGFAFNSIIIWDPKRWRRPTPEPIRQLEMVKDGFQVCTFIEQVVEDESQMEGLSEDCSGVMARHLQLQFHIPGSISPPIG